MNEIYLQGFAEKCAEYGVDPQALIKQAGLGSELMGWGGEALSKLKGLGHEFGQFGKDLWGYAKEKPLEAAAAAAGGMAPGVLLTALLAKPDLFGGGSNASGPLGFNTHHFTPEEIKKWVTPGKDGFRGGGGPDDGRLR